MNFSVYLGVLLALLVPIRLADKSLAGKSFVHPTSVSFHGVAATNNIPLTNITTTTEMPSQFCCTPYCRECYESLSCDRSSRLACMNAGPVSLSLPGLCSWQMSQALEEGCTDTVTVQYLLRDRLIAGQSPRE